MVWSSVLVGSLLLLIFGCVVLVVKPTVCRGTSNLSTATALETAVIQFRGEYGTLPDPRNLKTPSDATISTTGEEGERLLAILTGRETGSTHQNLHDLNFFPCREVKKGKNGLIELPSRAIELRDSSGDPYYLRIDFDQNEELTVPGEHWGTETIRGRRVAVYSLGHDDKDGVRTW